MMSGVDTVCADAGYIKKSDLEGMSIEDIQDMIDVIEDLIKVDTANLRVLKDRRSELGLELFKTTYPNMTSFETSKHIFIKQPKSGVSGTLFNSKYPLLWRELAQKHPEMLSASKDDTKTFLSEKQMSTDQIQSVLKDVCVEKKPSVTAKKRTVH